MRAGKIENQFETGFQQPRTGLPKTGINISKYDAASLTFNFKAVKVISSDLPCTCLALFENIWNLFFSGNYKSRCPRCRIRKSVITVDDKRIWRTRYVTSACIRLLSSIALILLGGWGIFGCSARWRSLKRPRNSADGSNSTTTIP